jgi:hypothetical protein
MGLADRDYMRERRQEDRHFTPPEQSMRSTLWTVLFWVALTFLVYKAVVWWQSRPTPPRQPVSSHVSPPPVLTPSTRQSHPQLTGNWDPNRTVPTSIPPPPVNEARTISKCVVNGVITYSDGACPHGVPTARLTIDSSRNVADALPSHQRQEPPPQAVIQPVAEAVPAENMSPDFASKRALCLQLDEAVNYVDARARQALPAHEQDRLAAERKRYRDEQFRLHC